MTKKIFNPNLPNNTSINNSRFDRSLRTYIEQYRRGGSTWVTNHLIRFRSNGTLFINEPTLQEINKQFITQFASALGKDDCYSFIMEVLLDTFEHLGRSNISFTHQQVTKIFISKINKRLEKASQLNNQ
ncbi:hypothetical protein CIB95_11865 [Lottiidibacillus patelloidae]|uniref:Uncharacterized protein n=1 Tax=Lottiidibacillus patelloidae TaxID=2670334 RepID=A0A263BRY8_9BACI|nr:hypothetical protein [Lottiidibacillus patelloidae]OZM56465.1 hypothetical protein CIB95_11865 [Lottiidibacillus patelloidae]